MKFLTIWCRITVVSIIHFWLGQIRAAHHLSQIAIDMHQFLPPTSTPSLLPSPPPAGGQACAHTHKHRRARARTENCEHGEKWCGCGSGREEGQSESAGRKVPTSESRIKMDVDDVPRNQSPNPLEKEEERRLFRRIECAFKYYKWVGQLLLCVYTKTKQPPGRRTTSLLLLSFPLVLSCFRQTCLTANTFGFCACLMKCSMANHNLLFENLLFRFIGTTWWLQLFFP